MQAIQAALKKHFGFDSFHPGQLETIQSILAGQDTLAVLPTGSGKSLIYQLSGYLMSGTVLIISPLLSLMQDQVARMQFDGERSVVALNSLQTPPERRQALRHLATTKFVFASPEIVQQAEIKRSLNECNICLLVIDEAHCISTWGPDFRPDYLDLNQLHHQLNGVPVLMLTATATEQVRHDILNQLGIQQAKQLIYSVDRPNIFLSVRQVNNDPEKRELLLKLVSQIQGSGIIYFSSKKVANQICEWLQQESGLQVAAYHSDITGHARFQIQQQFMQNDLDLICATSAFGMGIDKADIRYVIHYHPAANLEDYVQEIGRAGRDNQQAIAVLLAGPRDQELVRLLNEQNLPERSVLQLDFDRFNSGQKAVTDLQLLLDYYWRHQQSPGAVDKIFNDRRQAKEVALQAMQHYIQTPDCRRSVILNYFGEASKSHHQTCCALAEEALPLALLNLQRQTETNNDTASVRNWQEQLATLFLPNS